LAKIAASLEHELERCREEEVAKRVHCDGQVRTIARELDHGRVNVMIQFVSHIFPSSSENACFH
jgi:hypothetical protein